MYQKREGGVKMIKKLEKFLADRGEIIYKDNKGHDVVCKVSEVCSQSFEVEYGRVAINLRKQKDIF